MYIGFCIVGSSVFILCVNALEVHHRILVNVGFNFYETVFVSDNMSKLAFLHMKPNDAGKDMWLWAQTANEKLNEEAQTAQDADGMQVLSMFITTQLEAIS